MLRSGSAVGRKPQGAHLSLQKGKVSSARNPKDPSLATAAPYFRGYSVVEGVENAPLLKHQGSARKWVLG